MAALNQFQREVMCVGHQPTENLRQVLKARSEENLHETREAGSGMPDGMLFPQRLICTIGIRTMV
jgi:hypothetical protein